MTRLSTLPVPQCPTATRPQASIQGIVRKAACAKWGKIYLTDDVLPNPWNALPSFWETLVAAVNSADGSDCPDQQTTLMVPLYLDSNPGALSPAVDGWVKPDEGVLNSRRDK